MRSLGKELSSVAMSDRNARDFAPVELTAALTEVTASLGVYRTYIREARPSEGQRAVIRRAVAQARERAGTAVDERIFHFVELVLLVDPRPYLEAERDRWLAFVMRWQQFTGRVMAKGVEDTAFYVFNRLISLNEVGGDPGRTEFDPLREFHELNRARAAHWPDALNATSTHDTKRSEDARARINVLSEIPRQWTRQVRRWSKMNADLRRNGVPNPNDEILLYQTLAGMWPLDERDVPGVVERLRAYLEKAAREAKTWTSWLAPDVESESALLGFATAALERDVFLRDFLRFQKRVAFYGILNSLAQVVLKAAAPGVPDFYQGTEIWDFSLVDPDNRRPVDYERRAKMLRRVRSDTIERLLRNRNDGRIKMFVIWKMLDLRARHAETFTRGAYAPLDGGEHVCAFARGEDFVVAVPRLVTSLVPPGRFPLGAVWGDAAIDIRGRWVNAFTGEVVEGGRLAEIFARFPVAALERISNS